MELHTLFWFLLDAFVADDCVSVHKLVAYHRKALREDEYAQIYS